MNTNPRCSRRGHEPTACQHVRELLRSVRMDAVGKSLRLDPWPADLRVWATLHTDPCSHCGVVFRISRVEPNKVRLVEVFP